MIFSIIVATSENQVIGKNNSLPWHISDDLKRFKMLTIGHPVIMGRKTFESIGKPLPGRENIVISRSAKLENFDVKIFRSIEECIEYCKKVYADQDEEVFIIGGAEIYKQMLHYVSRVYQTLIHQRIEGDAFFPKLNLNDFKLIRSEKGNGDPAHDFLLYERVT